MRNRQGVCGLTVGILSVLGPELWFSPRVGTDYLYWKSSRVGLFEKFDFECRVGDLVGRLGGIFEINLAKKMSSE